MRALAILLSPVTSIDCGNPHEGERKGEHFLRRESSLPPFDDASPTAASLRNCRFSLFSKGSESLHAERPECQRRLKHSTIALFFTAVARLKVWARQGRFTRTNAKSQTQTRRQAIYRETKKKICCRRRYSRVWLVELTLRRCYRFFFFFCLLGASLY